MLTISVDDVDEHYEAARSAGATITEELGLSSYGERQYGAHDLSGRVWMF